MNCHSPPPLTAGRICEAMPDVTFGAVSQQLRHLRDAGSRLDGGLNGLNVHGEGDDNVVQMAGTNVFVFGPDGRIRSVVGFW